MAGDFSAACGLRRMAFCVRSSEDDNVRAILPGMAFTNFTYSLKARKLSGREGFLVLFNVADPEAKSWWNVGGWGNDHHALELGDVVGNETKGSIETNRWYDIRVEVTGTSVKCYLDGKLTSEGQVPKMRSLCASATHAEGNGDVILKIVNTSAEPQDTEVQLDGIASVESSAKLTVLSSERPEDENSLDQPEKVSPKTETVAVNGKSLRHVFPGNSFTVLRIRTK